MAPREREVVYDDQKDQGPTTSKTVLSKQDEWIDKMDLKAFREDIKELGKRLSDEQGPDDVNHLHKMIMWSNMFTLAGILGMGFLPAYYLLPAICLSIGTTTRWTMIAHHTCHGGYDNCEKSGRFNRFKFAVGSTWRRFLDWFDWMLPEAWNVEHNNMHHYHLGEDSDPDLVERNLAYLRDLNAPMFIKYIAAFAIMAIWKWWYYSPNTFKELRVKEIRKTNPALLTENSRFDPNDPITLTSMIFDNSYLPSWISLSDFMARVFMPYLVYRFMIIPLPLLAAGMHFNPESPNTWYLNAIGTLLLADVIGNIHSFVIIATNHAGNDLYTFSVSCRPRSGTFYLRQVVSSANFAAGTDLVDFFHGWLNYQVEHHMWPDLSMLSYQRAMPRVKEICKRHHIPYIQESVFLRLKKTVDIMVGASSMRPYPVDREQDI